MLNERKEFEEYRNFPIYAVENKRDTSYLGRFTFDTIMNGEGLTRILTILARGYLWDNNGDIELARQALCAWCSIPNKKTAHLKQDWQFESDFKNLHTEFPELVDENGAGWFYRHVHHVADFVLSHPDMVSKSAQNNAEIINKKWDAHWRKKVMQYQIPIFAQETKGGWIIRFDDILADAIELGSLRETEPTFTEDCIEKIKCFTPKGVPTDVLLTLYAYYQENKPEDTDWVVLPVSSFDAYFGTTSFSRKWVSKIPPEFMERQKPRFGVCRYRINN